MGMTTLEVFLEKHTELTWRTSRYSKVCEDNRKMTTYREMKVLHIVVRDTVHS